MLKRFKLIFLILLIFLVVFLELLAGDPASASSHQSKNSRAVLVGMDLMK